MIYQWTQVIDIKSEQKIVAHNKLKDSSMHSSVFDDFFVKLKSMLKVQVKVLVKNKTSTMGKKKATAES